MSITVTDIQGAFTNGLLAKVEPKLREGLVSGENQTTSSFKIVNNVQGDYIAPVGMLSTIMQPHTSEWRKKGDLQIIGNRISTRKVKVNIEVKPQDLYDTFAELMYDPTKPPTQQQIVTAVSNMMLKRIIADREKVIGKGVYDALGTDVIDCYDGYLTLIEAGTGAQGKMSSIELDAITESSAFDVIEKFAQLLPEELQTMPLEIHCSYTVFMWYMKQRRETIGGNNDYSGIDTNLFGTPHKLKWLASMSGVNDMVWASPMENKIFANYRAGLTSWPYPTEYGVKLLAEWNEGVGFSLDEAVFVSKVKGSGDEDALVSTSERIGEIFPSLAV